jgi:gamma-glutamyltranspeptidase/glutathione hydrolase
VGDVPESRFLLEKLLAPDSIAEIRAKALGTVKPRKVAAADFEAPPFFYESPMAATTHFIVADRHGNIVCATQSQSLHFGAGVVPPGTGVVMNDSMSNFSFTEPKSINYLMPGRRSRSTIGPTIVLHQGKPDFAIGIPGASRIPTALLQALLDRLALKRTLAEAIGDTRVHYVSSYRRDQGEAFEAEQSFPHAESTALQTMGWKVNLPEPAGTGRYFGGINAIEFNVDGTLTGYADPRRTNVAGGY